MYDDYKINCIPLHRNFFYSNSKESNIFFLFSCKCDVFLIEFHNIFEIVMLSVTKGKTLLNFLEWERVSENFIQ